MSEIKATENFYDYSIPKYQAIAMWLKLNPLSVVVILEGVWRVSKEPSYATATLNCQVGQAMTFDPQMLHARTILTYIASLNSVWLSR